MDGENYDVRGSEKHGSENRNWCRVFLELAGDLGWGKLWAVYGVDLK